MSWLDMIEPAPDALKEWEEPLYFEKGSLPVSEIHQSWLSTFRYCPRKAKLYSQYEGGKASFFMFGGSVFHQAMEEAIKSEDMNRWLGHSSDIRYWHHVFDKVFERNPESSYSNDINFDRFAEKLTDKKVLYGSTIGQIIYGAINILWASGFTILECEKEIVLKIGDGTPYVGTLDLLLDHPDKGPTIADTKTGGIWQRYFKDKPLSSQKYTPSQVSNHLQLTHYGWQGWRAGLWGHDYIKSHMIFTPVNLTTNVRGPKKGQFRGAPFHFGKPHTRNWARYEEDIAQWLKLAHSGFFPRFYPAEFGKMACERCAFAKACLEDKASELVPSYIPTGGELM